MDYLLAHKDSVVLEKMYRLLLAKQNLNDDEKDLKQDILSVLNRRGWRLNP